MKVSTLKVEADRGRRTGDGGLVTRDRGLGAGDDWRVEGGEVEPEVDGAIVKRRAPLLTVIVRQGIQEGVFTTSYPDQVSKVILSLALGTGNTVARLLLFSEQESDDLGTIRGMKSFRS